MDNQEPADVVNQQASVWMKRGIALLNQNTPASLKEAIGFFDQAITLRWTLPLAGDPLFRYGLAAGWMNRGDALTRLGSCESLAEAVRSYDAALETLRGLPLDANPLFRRRLAIAHVNRGLTLYSQNNQPARTEAGQSFKTAIITLHNGNASMILDRDYLLAVAWMNYANVLVGCTTGDSALRARITAKQAILLADRIQNHDSSMAEVGLKARHVLCQAIAKLLVEINSAELADELITEGTDSVDEGLALARSWEQRGGAQFRRLAQDLFRFGALIYQRFQPHFLNEFILENLDPLHSPGAFARDSEMHATALESVWRTFHKIQRWGFQMVNTPQFEEFLGKLGELRIVEDRLTELRRKHLPMC